MIAPYRSAHPLPTPRQRELLGILQEECAEVIKAVSKALRFGLGDGYPGSEISNRSQINIEVNDVGAALTMLMEAGIIDQGVDGDPIGEKMAKIRAHLQSEPDAI